MVADPSFYSSKRLAESYARFRPAVHHVICDRLLEPLTPEARSWRVLDVGCGAGASTAALLPYSAHLFGVDPYPPMLEQARTSVTGASFVQGGFEALPFEADSFDLLASAGAINYVDAVTALTEVERVLQPGGWFMAYDFSTGQRLTIESPLPDLHAEFRRKYPSSPGYALHLPSLPFASAGLSLVSEHDFVVQTPMSAEQYVQYALGDSGVELALAGGESEEQIRRYCKELFSPAFIGQTRNVVFEVQAVLARKHF
ncbi:MAG: class I SAM-dependent methyltransferase [Burkholderiaceae bacterium]